MKKHLYWIAAVIGLTLIIDRAGGFFFNRILKNSQFRYSQLYTQKDSADILFVGNSRGLTFYQPEVVQLTGKKTQNLSYNGLPANLAQVLVSDYLEKQPLPKILIVDVTLCDRQNPLLVMGFAPYVPYSERLAQLLQQTTYNGDVWAGKKVYYGGQVSHLYRFNSEIYQRAAYYWQKSDKDWLIDRVIGADAARDTALSSYNVNLQPDMVTALAQMVKTAQSKGVTVKLVINPYFAPFAERLRPSFLTPLKQAVTQATQLPVHDFSVFLSDTNDLGDYQHANKQGSIKYMQHLYKLGFFDF